MGSCAGNFSVRAIIAHTKLKFWQPGQTSVDKVQKRNLCAELLAAEAEARAKKRKATGLPVEGEAAPLAAIEDGEANTLRNVLQDAPEMDKDADSGEEEEAEGSKGDGDEDGKGDDDDDEEDDTAELLRELEKIKRERAADKGRAEQGRSRSHRGGAR
ncbi:Pre-mRNA-splicing factor Cwf15/Cwc15 [Gloeopeniophorella convolvens]|nr:Pre-mRNA-splicing factor Cwf15/Cwc15 [Gloeopeniophorella convolvens]